MAENSAGDFYRELDNFRLHMPGRHIVPFADNESLLKMLRCQYPNWETNGKVTSVPVARVPRLFLQNTQMSKKLQNDLKPLQTGEVGEIKIYRLLLEAADPDQKGMMVFPNVNPREIFKSESAHVEIDIVVAHPAKGFFVFNIKNQGGKGSSPEKIQKDIKRHGQFVRSLMQYGHAKLVHSIPIHSVICWLHDDNKKKFDSIKNPEGHNLIFSRSELKADTFASEWFRILKWFREELPDLNTEEKTYFEITVARLVTLSSLESSSALIHDQLVTNYMQATNKNKGQFNDPRFDPDAKSLLETASRLKRGQSKNNSAGLLGKYSKEETLRRIQTESNKNVDNEKTKSDYSTSDSNRVPKLELKKNHGDEFKRERGERFIIWTEEQLNIIAKVVDHLRNPTEKGYLRLIVRGCKGSGKTMLLVFLAKIAKQIFASISGDSSNRNDVCALSGRLEHAVLTEMLKQLLNPHGVPVYDPSVSGVL